MRSFPFICDLPSSLPLLIRIISALFLALVSDILEQFFSSKEMKCILIPDSLKVVTAVPKLSKVKCLTISKTVDQLTEANIRTGIFIDEIGGVSSFEHLELVSTQVLLPLLSSQMNQASWGTLTSREITDCFHSFLSSSAILCGQVKGETRLPAPPSLNRDSGSSTGVDMALLESSIITWTNQIKSVLKQDPETQLKLGLHPTPDVEILFWTNKANNLNSIFDQLEKPETRRVLEALEEAKSTYCLTFARMCKEVFAARLEANDNMKHLKTLEKWVLKLNEDDFVNVPKLFKPILHTIMLIWKHSTYYNTPSRLVILIREICNSIIDQACRFVSGEQIFSYIKNEEANIAVDQLLLVLKVCGSFKSTYFEYKTRIATDCPQNQWSIQNGALFARLDSFIERSHDILDLTKTIIQFSKLSKVEIGGTKGSTLTSTIQQIKDDFQRSADAVKNLEYDIMDIKAVQFDSEYSKFRKVVKEVERRLGGTIGLAMDDCDTVYGRFQLVDTFDKQLLDRPIIQDEVEGKQIALIRSYGKDLKAIQEEFLHYQSGPPKEVFRNLPPISGALSWCHGLIARAKIPMEKMQELDRNILDREEAKEVIKVQRAITSSLLDFERRKTKDWGQDVESITGSKLELHLLRRMEESRKLVTNFDPALVRLLREVKYFLLLGLTVPDSALKIYQSADIFRARTGNLDLIVNMNNSFLDTLLPVEKPLIEPYLAKFDVSIQPGLETLNWQSDGVDKFIGDSMEQVKVVHVILKTMKDNLSTVQDIVKQWDRPMFERKTKPMEREEFERIFKSMQASNFSNIKVAGEQIHSLLKETNNVLKVSSTSAEWKHYVGFANSVIIKGMSAAIMTSLNFLLDQINPEIIRRDGRLPLFEIVLVVDGSQGVNFQPPLGRDLKKLGMSDMIDNVVGSCCQISTLFQRLGGEGTYIDDVHSDTTIKSAIKLLSDVLVDNEIKCLDLKRTFDKYSYLWETNLASYFKDFCEDAAVVTKHGTKLLDLDKFDKAILTFVEAQAEVAKAQSSFDIGWLRIDVTPAKRDVSLFATKWINLFTSHMRGSIIATLAELHKFMESVNQGLSRQVNSSPDDVLAVMTVIRDVRLKAESVPELFGPQRDCVQVLRRYGVDVLNDTVTGTSRTVQNFLEEAPLAWEAVVKKTFKKKEEILPTQIAKVDALKLDLDAFYLSIRKFRGDFRAQAPFKFEGDCSTAFEIIDSFTLKLDQLEVQIEKSRELEDLFELQPTTYPEIGETRSEIKQLILLWKFKVSVSSVYESWEKELWSVVNAIDLEEKNKRLRKQLKEMGAANLVMKGWQVYRDIDDSMTVMATVLPLVSDLHADAIRARHWAALARVCNVKAVEPSDPMFTLRDMLLLKLDSRKQEIEGIIEIAMKELKIEKKLTEIDGVWSCMELNYSAYKDTGMFLPRPSEEVVECMEAHQMELQGIYGMGAFMEYFKDRVVQWQSTLRTVDDTLRMWLVVARSWASLESIFLASADIRSQLPEDTKRFEGIDADFKQLMKTAVLEVNCVKVCSIEGRYEALRSMSEKLEMCQKSLKEYLDIKKKVFPRFYFVSSVALLDILANGTNPPKIMPYLGDCYDSLANLDFVTLEDGKKSSKTVNKMIAKDGEVVQLHENFTMNGEVEVYLNRLTESMRKSLKVILSDAIEKAVNWDIDTPRHEWLFNYPAQLCITGTQIYWTDETQLALEEYEGGQEDAVKRYLQTCNTRLSALIQLVLGDLSSADRTKIISLITMDVHSRDVVDGLITQKTEGPNAFAWQKQMRFEWEQSTEDVNVKICDFSTKYFYEWVGNSGRLVITPLTDRCYITLTMALKLYLGGAPAGPAGTGKTETTKDLARALAVPCYVFNCSDQMNFQSIADIFRGLAQTGAWGCFDEFNRIPIEVLSVVATQVKTIQDAIVKLSRPENRDEKYKSLPSGTPPTTVGSFEFMGDTISLIPTCGFFITMNPGYAGRTELPENLKALFRSCAMIRPDFKLIQENMLMAEGFQTARALSVKFNTLYELSLSLLSKQPHYDWGLRAVKSVLRVAGGMKRANPTMSEDQVLMRALRDFNTPKMPTQDIPIFLRLVNDLFPGLVVESKVDEDLKAKIVRVAKERGLQYDEVFVNKTCNFQELLNVRHSVMLLGPAGCAKTTIWKTLQGAHNLDKKKNTCVAETVNPKAVTGDELYGYMTLAKDWKDGVLSIIMRGMSKNFADQGFHDYQTNKWVVLDGDIDAVWIESMNTVMDDNKVLTLVSNERVPLTSSMRMVFEINSLKNASPATVSRAGILFINEADVGWRPLVETWVQGRQNSTEKNNLPSLFDRYVDTLVEMTRRGYKEVTSLRLINKVSTIIYLLEGLLPLVPEGKLTPETIEMLFAFSAMWAFGGPMIIDKTGDYRKKFSEDYTAKFGLKYPKDGLCFDFFYDPKTGEHVHWQSLVPKYSPIPIGTRPGETPFCDLFVDTVETVRITYLLDKLVRNGKYAMLVGNAGTGKTEIIRNYLDSLDKEKDCILSKNIVMSYYTTSFTLQNELEGYIDKRSRNTFGPPMGKKMVFFIDDINLPFVETYGTQNSISLLTQHMAYGSVFDRTDLGMRKQLLDIQYIAAMNPTSGSFEICERAQRHFATFAIAMPSQSDLNTIFTSLFGGHMNMNSFQPIMQELTSKIVDTAIRVHEAVSTKFLPSAVRFMYNWNMRELTNIFQGCCLAKGDYYIKPAMLARLYTHESQRVYADRLVTEEEVDTFYGIFNEIVKSGLVGPSISAEELLEPNNVFTNFVTTADGAYLPIPSMDKLKSVLDTKLIEYNDNNAIMDLVLFKQATLHITRINRIIQNPGGNAMLVGVGGSGKQSLCRLAAYMSEFEVRQISVTSNYGVEDLKEQLRSIYMTAGVKGKPIVFLMTDSQIVNEKFLVYINGMITSGWIPDLFAKEDMDNILGSIANEAKSVGIPDNPEARTAFFVSKVKKNLHVVLAFSPVGDTFRVRARRFPGLVNNTVINQFHPWPRDALVSVAERFLQDVDMSGSLDVRKNLSEHMAEEHLSVASMSRYYLATQRRYNYVTPKSYLELISFFKFLLGKKQADLQRLIDRLDVGLSTLRKTSQDVAELQKDLKITLEKVGEKKIMTDKLIKEMSIQQADAQAQQESAQQEAKRADEESQKAMMIETEAEKELGAAKPAMEAAAAAVDCLSKAMLSELKNLGKPPAGVDKVTNTCLILIEKEYNEKKFTWNRAKAMMGNIDGFKAKLSEFRGEDINEQEIALLKPYIDDPDFTPEKMASKSAAAANLCTWVVNIYNFNRIYVKVKPLMDSLQAARESKAAAIASLEGAKQKVAEVQQKLAILNEKYIEAVKEKKEVEDQAAVLTTRADLAQRLVGGLASENVRWGKEIERLKCNASTLVGDCMLAAGFVSYVGAFDKELREELWRSQWSADLRNRGIPMTENSDPLEILSDKGNNSQMISEGLPSDRVSLENGAVLTNCKRWPLLIDPQAQAIKWLMKKEEGNLDVIQLTQKNWLKILIKAITNGRCVIIENIGTDIDAMLDPVLSRSIYKKGRSLYLKLGGEEVEYDPGFQLYLQTKLSNPHYKPEISAQCTLINFIATERGLEDQLLAKVVELERPDLEEKARALTTAASNYQLQLIKLEDELLERLANAPEDILSDIPLIEGLEATKKTAQEISVAVETGKITQKEVEQAREAYRPQASEGAMLYFLLTKLCVIDHMYQYSLDSFMYFFKKSVMKTPARSELQERVLGLRDSLRITIFTWVSRGLFERHKLIFLAQLTFNLMKRGIISTEWNEGHFQFLIRAPTNAKQNPLDWLPDSAWATTAGLSDMEEFGKLTSDLVEAAPRFREWFNLITPEDEKLPLDWAGLDRTPFQKMLVVRCLRPDRMTSALTSFIRGILPDSGSYIECDSRLSNLQILDSCLEESTPKSPIYFILSPGVNVVADLDKKAADYGLQKGVTYHNVSMGQGQDVVAMSCLETAHRNGHWVILNNVHLMPTWLSELEKKLDEYAVEGSHEKFRVFLTSDPSTAIPIGILNRCIKLTSEPPTGLKANLKRAWGFFAKDYIDEADSKTKSILFGLCHFHSILMERKQFGPMGYNMKYPFGIGDLRDSAKCLQNYMDNIGGGKIPWQDLKYIFGEIMYGGHIVNDFDRLLANEYLNFYMKDELLDEMELYPYADDEKGVSFMSPAPTSFEKYLNHIDKNMTGDTPIAFGLHPNAEIEFRTQQSNAMFTTLLDLQPKGVSNGEGVASPLQVAATTATELLEKFEEKNFDIDDLVKNLDEIGPYQNVFIQEMEVMNTLLAEIRRSIKELQMGFAGELTMSEAMEELMMALYLNRVPASWTKRAWPSKMSLGSWMKNFSDRLFQLEEWQSNPSEIPKVTWLSGLVNPTSFLTAICQVAAQKNQWELDKLVTFTRVTKYTTPDEVDGVCRDGAYITGLSLQGASIDIATGFLQRSKPKEISCKMPVIHVKAVTRDKANIGGIYSCPVYATEQRGPTWFWNAQMKTSSPPARWTLGGVALIGETI